jgi:hypothetical protein
MERTGLLRQMQKKVEFGNQHTYCEGPIPGR